MDIIKREHAEIQSLKRKLCPGQQEEEIKKLREAHKKLLRYNKERRTSTKTVSPEKNQQLLDELKKKDDEIKDLEHENIPLKDQLAECQDCTGPSLKVGSKTYSVFPHDGLRPHSQPCAYKKHPSSVEKNTGTSWKGVRQHPTTSQC